MKLNLFPKFFLVVSVVAIVVTIVASYFTISSQKQLINKFYYNQAVSLVLSLDAGIVEHDLQEPELFRPTLLKLLLLNPDINEITIHKPNDLGEMMSFISTSTSLTQDSKDETDAKESLEKNIITTHSEYRLGKPVLEIFAPLHLSGRIAGVYHLVISLTQLDIFIQNQISQLIVLVFVALFLFIFGLSVFVRTIISKPLGRLVQQAKKIEQGDFNLGTNIKTKDEIGELSEAFFQMAKKLRHSYEKLEQRVEEKTQQLSQALKNSQQQNIELEKNKNAMINLLEDSKALEEELAREKKSVEEKIIERTNQLSSEKTKLSASISSLSIGFIMLDEQNKILVINRRANMILNQSDKKPVALLQDLIDLFLKNSQIHKLFESYNQEKIKIEKKGEVDFGSKILRVSFLPILKQIGEDIEVLGMIVLIDDITEEKMLSRSRDEFFSIASHELRTPLTAIRGNTDMIMDHFSNEIKSPDFKEMLGDIHESSERLIAIVNDFLDMSRLELNKIEFKNDSFDPVEAVQHVIEEYQVTGSRKGTHLELNEVKEVIPKAFADRDKFKQILINLVTNSMKFTEKGKVTISLSQEDNFIKISVNDTGIGIPEKNQSFLFRKFQQAENNILTRDGTKGTGLGLYISKLLIEKMGGKIWLESSIIGKGSTFSFTVPIG